MVEMIMRHLALDEEKQKGDILFFLVVPRPTTGLIEEVDSLFS